MVCGMMLLLVSGTFDLSVGGTFSWRVVAGG
jgi:ribose/xylose/arabinose/galactoside ABC-type transport system permease subunit